MTPERLHEIDSKYAAEDVCQLIAAVREAWAKLEAEAASTDSLTVANERLRASVDAIRAEGGAEITRLRERVREAESLRATVKRLNRRVQMAEAALTDAGYCIERLAAGKTPWCGGSLGRALLAYDNMKQRERIAELTAALREGGDE